MVQQTAWLALVDEQREAGHTKDGDMGGHVACLGERRGFWWGNLKERCHLGYPDVRWDNNIKIGIKETGWALG